MRGRTAAKSILEFYSSESEIKSVKRYKNNNNIRAE